MVAPSAAPAPDPRVVQTFTLHDRTYTKGDQIVVRPSAPRHRDGFTARVISARLDDTGTVSSVDVFGAPGKKAPLTRTLRPERLAPLPTRRRKRPIEEETP